MYGNIMKPNGLPQAQGLSVVNSG
uniref:Uncharacterized protein n=1 Tax=Anguilla anguilla TaxID=7936 RepID=A0A0E9UGR9_ANGAN